VDRLSLFKLLADRSRYSIYHELAGTEEALSAVDIAARLNLHPNTVRLHLEKMREAGLVEAAPDRHGSVGRPQYRWRAKEPSSTFGPLGSLGPEPAGFRLLAHLLAEVAAGSQPEPGTAASVGMRHVADRPPGSRQVKAGGAVAGCIQALLRELAQLGFDPALAADGDPSQDGDTAVASILFTSCPFRELAVKYPDVVCELHRGITNGLTSSVSLESACSGEVLAFSSLVDQDPCRVEVSFGAR
jgi:predicted ArsR family transcriptional regulator